MDAVSQQERAGVVVRGMAERRIGVSPLPGQDGGAVDDEIAPADEAPVAREAHEHDEQALAGWGAHLRQTPALLGRAGDQHASAGVGECRWAAHRPGPRRATPPTNRTDPDTTSATGCAAAQAARATRRGSGADAHWDQPAGAADNAAGRGALPA